jgi:ribose 5-phosphate isomerase
MGVQLEKRNSTATAVQDVLTEFGCYIQTRIGLHQTAGDACSEKGLIILELTDNAGEESAKLEAKLTGIPGVGIQKMVF